MRILIAEDDPMSGFLLKTTLTNWSHEVIATTDGSQALEILQSDNPPPLAVLDWMMPLLDGTEICRRLRASSEAASIYIIMLTAKGERKDRLDGLAAGADDYLTKPFDAEELKARVGVGVRMVEIQQILHKKVQELEVALGQVKQLQGILPICSYCKHVRDDQNYWQQVETYVSSHSEAEFSHSICPACYQKEVQPLLDKFKSDRVK
jgi:sigma-B regulation protein RsbU (phosphoserine phosphatase)